ncbi:hypothetical protein GGR53DRAFT_528976 [Hypoxylon sp. FL1150]|nr:hypothetical protein GGR53DRAFT_528976 [Hypoxylon sp. FL1150]
MSYSRQSSEAPAGIRLEAQLQDHASEVVAQGGQDPVIDHHHDTAQSSLDNAGEGANVLDNTGEGANVLDAVPALCVVCGDTVTADSVQLPCGHHVCNRDLKAWFLAAINDRSIFPARCCQQLIPLHLAEQLLEDDTIRIFRNRVAVLANPDDVSCHVETCATVFPRDVHHEDTATCADCGAQTCMMCGGAAHPGDCPYDEDDQAVIALAVANGWKRCPICRFYIERDGGCHEMTCTRCHHTFCYLCCKILEYCSCQLDDVEHQAYQDEFFEEYEGEDEEESDDEDENEEESDDEDEDNDE